ncbi:unnamed protein product [Paramecium pentaurelia]|uniref:Kazal-like domain-containing protein n=1 Tax=Paramecium pentaurelia TaxID=43138 RepID=A0A8S1T1J1_9CILI|nr:unnamed protein product [Paramecium pentaurelia]
MIFFLLFQLIRTQIFDCSITQSKCSDNYSPVCGFTINMQQIQTYINQCYACKANLVVKYMNGECIDHQDEKTSNNHIDQDNQNTNSTFTPSGNQTQFFSCFDPRPSICGTNLKRTCGFLDSLTHCNGKYCYAQFINECHACRNTSIHNYFFGDCSEYKQTQPTVIQCNLDIKNQCDIMEQIDVCGFLDETTVCQNQPCLQPFKNTCEPCNQSNIKSYFIGNCNDYQYLFLGQEQEEDVLIQKYQYCQPERPSTCNQEFSQTCGVLKSCNGTACERIYDNPCDACKNTQIEGYYIGQCQQNFGYVIQIFMIQLLI